MHDSWHTWTTTNHNSGHNSRLRMPSPKGKLSTAPAKHQALRVRAGWPVSSPGFTFASWLPPTALTCYTCINQPPPVGQTLLISFSTSTVPRTYTLSRLALRWSFWLSLLRNHKSVEVVPRLSRRRQRFQALPAKILQMVPCKVWHRAFYLRDAPVCMFAFAHAVGSLMPLRQTVRRITSEPRFLHQAFQVGT